MVVSVFRGMKGRGCGGDFGPLGRRYRRGVEGLGVIGFSLGNC